MSLNPETLVKAPLSVVSDLFNAAIGGDVQKLRDPSDWNIPKTFMDNLKGGNMIPSLNLVPISKIPANSLVRYRVMVQDSFDPEYYVAALRRRRVSGVDSVSGSADPAEFQFQCGKYRDYYPEEDGFESEPIDGVPYGVRMSFFCVPVPGEAMWAKKLLNGGAEMESEMEIEVEIGTDGGARKRAADELKDHNIAMDSGDVVGASDGGEGESSASIKPRSSDMEVEVEMMDDTTMRQTKAKEVTQLPESYPIPIRSENEGGAVFLKLYDDLKDKLRVGQVIEFVGILAKDPILSSEDESELGDFRNIPQSLVPRIHGLYYTEIEQFNPYNGLSGVGGVMSSEEILRARATTIGALAAVLGGDEKAAAMILSGLLSRVWMRSGGAPVGNMGVSVSLPRGTLNEAALKTAGALSMILREIVPRFHEIGITVSSLNQDRYIPRKDYETGKLLAGQLQLAPGTVALFNEIAMVEGKLTEYGMRNLQSIMSLNVNQTLTYDFGHAQPEWDVNMVLISVAVGNGILQFGTRVPVVPKPGLALGDMSAIGSGVEIGPHLEAIRRYLAVCGSLECLVDTTPDTTQAIQSVFVAARQKNPKVTQDDLASWITGARCLARSYGDDKLTASRWFEHLKFVGVVDS